MNAPLSVHLPAPVELHDGPRYVNGRIHGSNWKKAYDVVVRFETKDDALAFCTAVTKLYFPETGPDGSPS